MEIHGSSMVFPSLVVLKKEIMFKNAGPLSGKTEMAAKVAQVKCNTFLNYVTENVCGYYYCSYKAENIGHGRALWAAHVHQISAL